MKDENKFIFGGDDTTEELENSVESSDDDSISDVENNDTFIGSNVSRDMLDSEETIYEPNNLSNESEVSPKDIKQQENKEALKDITTEVGAAYLQKMGVPKGLSKKALQMGNKLPGSKMLTDKAFGAVAKTPVGDIAKGAADVAKKTGADKLLDAKSGDKSTTGKGISDLGGKAKSAETSGQSSSTGSSGNKNLLLLGLPGMIFPFIIILVVVAIFAIPVIYGNEIRNAGKKVMNFFMELKYGTSEEIVNDFYKKIDEVVMDTRENLGVELDREFLTTSVIYGSFLMEDYVKDYGKVDADDREVADQYREITNYVASMAKEMVYIDTLVHNDTYEVKRFVQTIKTNDKGEQEVEQVEITEELCNGQEITKEKQKKLKENSDTYEERFDASNKTNKICASISYSQNLQKLEAFLKYAYIPKVIYNVEIKGEKEILWERLKHFLNNSGYQEDYFNIKMEYLVQGGEYDGYSELTDEQKKETDNIIRTILSLAKSSKMLSENYYIKGATSLPVDVSDGESIESRLYSKTLSYYGPRQLEGSGPFHYGIDIGKLTQADPIYSIADGIVTQANPNGLGSYGNYITIGHDINFDGKYDYYSRYAHLSIVKVKKGDIVNNGQMIGVMGTTGNSSGIHLHFEIRDEKDSAMDPLPFLKNIENKVSELSSIETTELNSFGVYNHSSELSKKIASNLGTRDAVVIASKYLIEKFNGLPYFCGGYTNSIIDTNWYKEKKVTGKSCPDVGNLSKYGLSVEGFVSWALATGGVIDRKQYSISELAGLGTKVAFTDSNINIGDLVWKENNIGVIIEQDDSRLRVVYMNTNKGLSVETINRTGYNGLFDQAIIIKY